ncbi:MAG: methionine--tRNA ligase [Flavobacteriales bacterium]|nr:methionine--tRNA ligase [Flavobacteriales bacterium]
MSDKKYIVTSALLYANGPIHIGHLAGAYLPADIYVRYLKNKGKDVVFICGSDEHGAAITMQAKKEGLTPQEIINKFHKKNKEDFQRFGINFSIYHRTSEKLHHETAQSFFIKLEKQKIFEKKISIQFYDNKHNQFLADRYILGTCPKCGYEHAYGDQCEKCGSALSPNELINPKSALSGEAPIHKETTHWYLPMQKHQEWLKNWIENGMLENQNHHDPNLWKKHVIGQCKSWLDAGLKPRAMTRDLNWGVKVPIQDANGKVLYVWLDAPIGYISATKQWALENNKNWEDYWKSENTELIHFIGKDNIVFHCIIFPIILKTHGEYILPKNVPANEFLNLEGEKLSTSRNWAIWLNDYLSEFAGKEDALRYMLCATAPENKDADFTWKDFQAKNNNELVAIFGNFINRVIVLINKYWNGKVPELNDIQKSDKEILKKLENYPLKISSTIEKFKFRDALSELIDLARLGNKYLADTEPWKLIKNDEKRTKVILNICVQITASLAILSEPFLPFASKKLKSILNMPNIKWVDAGKIIIEKNHQLNPAKHLFEKIEDTEIIKAIEKLKSQESRK